MQKIHEYGGFRVDKNELSKLFNIISNNPHLKSKDLEFESGFGKNKIENLKYYLKNFSLLDKLYKPTELGKIINTFDKYFEDEVTLWILLYQWADRLSNPFLYYLINESFGSKTKEILKNDFSSWAISNEIKTSYDKKDFVGGLISRTLNSFIEPDAFKCLNIFTLHEEKYSRDNPYKMNSLVMAYILYDNRLRRTTITFEEILREHKNIGKIFNLSREGLQQQIYGLRDLGLVQYVQTANLHHVIYTYHGTPNKLLEKYYEQY
jgi:hypothetical protein